MGTYAGSLKERLLNLTFATYGWGNQGTNRLSDLPTAVP